MATRQQKWIRHINGADCFERQLNQYLDDGWACILETLVISDNGPCSVLLQRVTLDLPEASFMGVRASEFADLKRDAENWRKVVTDKRSYEELQADAELGALVRKMRPGEWLGVTSVGWIMRDEHGCGSERHEIPEGALTQGVLCTK